MVTMQSGELVAEFKCGVRAWSGGRRDPDERDDVLN